MKTPLTWLHPPLAAVVSVFAVTLVTLPAILAETSMSAPAHVPARQIATKGNPDGVFLRSSAAYVYDLHDQTALLQRNSDKPRPIASLTKLMTAMVVIDSQPDYGEPIRITDADKDRIRYSRSRLPVNTVLTRYDALLITLAASENRAAAALARNYPGGRQAFIRAMNKKASDLGLTSTHFADPAGLSNDNVSTARELARLAKAADHYDLIKVLTTTAKDRVIDQRTGKVITFSNTNRLIGRATWQIELSKTGFTSDAGNCLVMKLQMAGRPLIVVLLNSWGTLSKYGDTNRIKKWLVRTEEKLRRPSL